MSAQSDAALVASLFAVDPVSAGGVCLRSPVHPAREQWLELLRDQLPAGTPWRRLPFNTPDGRLLGGLDLVATMRANRPIAERGALADAHGGVVILTMAERLTPQTAARLNAVLDAGEVSMSREGVAIRNDAAVGIVALDEGMAADERMPVSLLDRMAFTLDLSDFGLRTLLAPEYEPAEVLAARRRLPAVRLTPAVLEALAATAIALGAGSPRVSLLAAHVARVAAALEARDEVTEDDAVIAGRLVLAPRATIAPQTPPQPDEAPPPQDSPPEPPPPEPPPQSEAKAPDTESQALEIDQQTLEDVVLAATAAAIPAGLLARLRSETQLRAQRAAAGGRVGAYRKSGSRGRPAGVSAGAPRGGPVATAAGSRVCRRHPGAGHAGRFSGHALPAAGPNADHIRRRCVGLLGAEPTGRGQGCRGTAARRLLRAP
jgi:magnesium chelatase subunit D